MGDSCQCFPWRKKKHTERPPTLQEVMSSFEEIDITSQADAFITAIKKLLERNTDIEQNSQDTSASSSDKLSNWDSFIQSGVKFFKFVDSHTEKIEIGPEDDIFGSGEATKIVGNILEQIGSLHWVVAGLSIIGYLVSKYAKMSDNKNECLDLLGEIAKLVFHIKDLNNLIDEEKGKFEKAFQYIIKASIYCANQLDSGIFSSLLKSTVNSAKLAAIRSKISGLYDDLCLTVERNVLRGTPLLKEILPQDPPRDTVGIEHQLIAVNRLLNMKGPSSLAVILWGLGGIGKSTIAKAVASKLDRNYYNYARINLDVVSEKNNHEEMQRQILTDAFPTYEGGRILNLRDDGDGRDHIAKAFKDGSNRPVFLFIDNVLKMKDLEKILPENMVGLPQGSRILITCRILSVTDVLKERGLQRKDYPVKTLSPADALTLLCKDPATPHAVKDDLQEIVELCNGIPLVLKIVGGHLRKVEYDKERCKQILEALQKGKMIKQEDLTNRLCDFAHSTLEDSSKEAFLDICSFFYEDCLRRHVEYVVGAQEVSSLVDAALINTVIKEGKEMLSVHDIIRSMGRRMSEWNIVMDKNTWFEVKDDEARLRGIKGVCLEDEACTLDESHFHLMKNTLRILTWSSTGNVRATDAVTLPKLRFIKSDCHISGLNIEALDDLAFLECEKLPTKQEDILKLPKCLRCIKIRRQPLEMRDLLTTVPNFCLEELSLEFEEEAGFSDEEEAEYSDEEKENSKNAFNSFLKGLTMLKHLEVIKWPSLCELPEQVCKLPLLNTLRIRSCDQLEFLTEFFCKLITLTELELRDCTSLKELPSNFGGLSALTVLHLSGCKSLKKLPSTFNQFKALKQLDLQWCASLKKLPSTFGQLTSLRELNLSFCISLEELPSTFDQLIQLTKLNLSYCASLKELPSTLSNLRCLEYLDISMSNLKSDACQWNDNMTIVK